MGRLSRPILLYEAGANRFGTRTNAQKNTYTQAHRVKAHEDFQKIHDKGQSVVDGYGVFYFLPSPHDHSQLGTAVGKKLGNAVLRNKIKRRMRETFRQHQYRLKKPVSIVWVARRRLAHAPFAMYETVFCVWQRKPDCYRSGEAYENDRNLPDSFLSDLHFPSSRASLQVLSYVLPICAGSGEKVWFSERNLSGYEKITEMSSLP